VRTGGSALVRIGRGLAVGGVAIALVTGAAACSKTVIGSAAAGASPVLRTTTQPTPPGSGTDSTPPTSGSVSDSASQKAQETCAQLPKDAVTSSFGVTGVTVTADSGTTLAGGILQIKCVISAQGGFRANVVVQVYPSSVLSNAAQYQQIMQQKFSNVKTMTVDGADVAGTFQQRVDGNLVDEAFAAKKDTESNTIDVVLAGVADTPDIHPKLVAFITALAKD
jgi:hypothetical protein